MQQARCRREEFAGKAHAARHAGLAAQGTKSRAIGCAYQRTGTVDQATDRVMLLALYAFQGAGPFVVNLAACHQR